MPTSLLYFSTGIVRQPNKELEERLEKTVGIKEKRASFGLTFICTISSLLAEL